METKYSPSGRRRTITTDDGLEVTLHHSTHDLRNAPVTQQEIDLLMIYLWPLLEPILEKEE